MRDDDARRTITARRPPRDVILAAAVIVGCLGVAACSAGPVPTPIGTTPVTSATLGPPTSGAPTTASGPPVVVTTSAPAQPRFPAAVQLTWLDGISPVAAIRLRTNGVVRWQSTTPGEQAELLANDSYRWAGPDGSMVGCAVPSGRSGAGGVRRQRCVGIDPSGDVAVTSQPHGTRVVYGPGGRLIGEFRPGGARVSPAVPQPVLAQAISASGVDMASLVDFATRQPPFAGGVTGDPHLITTGGIRVSTQRAGDFQARSGDPDHQIQIRATAMPFQTDVSYVSAAVVAVPRHRIELSLTGAVTIDGALVADATTDEEFRQIPVPDGPELGLWPPDSDGTIASVLLWPDGSSVALTADPSLGMTVIAHLPTGPAGGLFGVESASSAAGTDVTSATPPPNIPDAPATGLAAGDFAGRSRTGAAGTIEQVVASWQVLPGESLFSGNAAPAEQPPGPPAQVSPAAALAAQNACATANMANTDDLTACVYDVARTGDDGYVTHHVELAAAATPAVVPASLATDWPALVLGAVSAPESVAGGAEINERVPAGARRLFRLTVDTAATYSVEAGPCPDHGTGDEAARGAAALRFFDRTGHPVSARRADCGHGATDRLPVGTYYLVLAGPLTGAAASFNLHLGTN